MPVSSCLQIDNGCFRKALPGEGTRDAIHRASSQPPLNRHVPSRQFNGGIDMNGVIYLVGLVVVVMFILSFLGLR
jgi:hypothetical protein